MLNVQNLQFSFGSRLLFKGLSFAVGDSEILRIAGPNGSGKSTLLSLIAGLIDGATGEIEFAGDGDFREWTAWIPADANALNPNLSATANLAFWQELRGRELSSKRFEVALSDWGLKGRYTQAHLPVGLFSTGMKRRLALARLELSASRLWLLDEPLFGLDGAACRKFRESLVAHLKAGGAALVVTHDERLIDGLPVRSVALGELS